MTAKPLIWASVWKFLIYLRNELNGEKLWKHFLKRHWGVTTCENLMLFHNA